MNLNKFSKENLTIAFYTIYILIAGICYELFPGDAKTPNFGVLLFYLFVPISLIYFMVHLIRQLYSGKSHVKCLIIHGVVWLSILIILSTFVK
ncbi:hypothetical protein GCM10022389_24710 [Flavobacterium cheonanense]|uniref:Uncharacterized protein n=1 Tax=Flavobacterium cheonanense TaxID=706183 RepID=A0ABP7W031_9FLAO